MGAVAVLALSAATASGATVDYKAEGPYLYDELTYAPAPGEQNTVRIVAADVPQTFFPSTYWLPRIPAVVIKDGLTPMSPGPEPGTRRHCVLLPGHATCARLDPQNPYAYWIDIQPIELGDRDDSIIADAPGFGILAFGGPGNDSFAAGSPGWVRWEGGPGADDFKGAPPGGGSLQTLDHVSYAHSGGGVEVTLDERPNDGQPGEGDNVHGSIDWVIGSPHADTLIGHDGENRLDGGLGDDRLVGGGAPDAFRGGEGADWIDARDGARDEVSCHGGDDVVLADAVDWTSVDCEQVEL